MVRQQFDSLSRGVVYGYNLVATIPAGATRLVIQQISHDHTSKDDNYLGETRRSGPSVGRAEMAPPRRPTGMHLGGLGVGTSHGGAGSVQTASRLRDVSPPPPRGLAYPVSLVPW